MSWRAVSGGPYRTQLPQGECVADHAGGHAEVALRRRRGQPPGEPHARGGGGGVGGGEARHGRRVGAVRRRGGRAAPGHCDADPALLALAALTLLLT